MNTIVLGLGNDLLADDGIGLLAAKRLEPVLHARADVRTSNLTGLALMEVLDGYEQAILIDAVQTGNAPPGTILELRADDLGRIIAPSPHYAGIPEMLALAKQIGMAFPQEIRIFAIEVSDTLTMGAGISAPVRAALNALTERICHTVAEWEVQHA